VHLLAKNITNGATVGIYNHHHQHFDNTYISYYCSNSLVPAYTLATLSWKLAVKTSTVTVFCKTCIYSTHTHHFNGHLPGKQGLPPFERLPLLPNKVLWCQFLKGRCPSCRQPADAHLASIFSAFSGTIQGGIGLLKGGSGVTPFCVGSTTPMPQRNVYTVNTKTIK